MILSRLGRLLINLLEGGRLLDHLR
jgi:hypothetical protein